MFPGGRWEGSAPPATDVTWYYISAMDAMHQVGRAQPLHRYMLRAVDALGTARLKFCFAAATHDLLEFQYKLG